MGKLCEAPQWVRNTHTHLEVHLHSVGATNAELVLRLTVGHTAKRAINNECSHAINAILARGLRKD